MKFCIQLYVTLLLRDSHLVPPNPGGHSHLKSKSAVEGLQVVTIPDIGLEQSLSTQGFSIRIFENLQ